MTKPMNINRISYLFYHLNFGLPQLKFLYPFFRFVEEASPIEGEGLVFFRLSGKEPDWDEPQWIDDLPVFYPLSDKNVWYSIDACGNLIFEHDILATAFYLLSAQQEVERPSVDGMGRFVHRGSLQEKFNVSRKPLVNYYFKILTEAFGSFSALHGLPFEVRKPFSGFVFFLGHDIDRVYFHHPREVAGRLLQLAGVRTREYPIAQLLHLLVADALNVWRFKKNDPWWTFRFLKETESENKIRGTYFFLPKTGNRLDSRYSLRDKNIEAEIRSLERDGFEVGLHLPLERSGVDVYFSEMSSVLGRNDVGVRRHFLKFRYPNDYNDDVIRGVRYDCSYGFSEHEGFRNSYCLPFRPYDHASEKMIDAWVLPLAAMDVTFLQKKKSGRDEIASSIYEMADEAATFGGILSLLWHNCRFDEINYPWIKVFYRDLIEGLMQKKARGIPGREVIAEIEALVDYSTFISDFNSGLISTEYPLGTSIV